MTLTISIPDNYAFVLLAGVGTGWLTLWQAFIVGGSRKQAKIPYPQGNFMLFVRRLHALMPSGVYSLC